MCKIQQTSNQLPIQYIVYHRWRISFFQLHSWKERSLSWIAILNSEFFQQIQAYLDWCTLIPSLVWAISSPKNWLKSPKSVMEKAWFIAPFKEAISSFELPIMRRSSKYNTMIINEPLINFKWTFGSDLYRTNSVIERSYQSWHTKPWGIALSHTMNFSTCTQEMG